MIISFNNYISLIQSILFTTLINQLKNIKIINNIQYTNKFISNFINNLSNNNCHHNIKNKIIKNKKGENIMKKNIIILLSLLFIGSVSSSIYAQPPKLILQTGTYITSGMPNSYIYISNTGTGYGNST